MVLSFERVVGTRDSEPPWCYCALAPLLCDWIIAGHWPFRLFPRLSKCLFIASKEWSTLIKLLAEAAGIWATHMCINLLYIPSCILSCTCCVLHADLVYTHYSILLPVISACVHFHSLYCATYFVWSKQRNHVVTDLACTFVLLSDVRGKRLTVKGGDLGGGAMTHQFGKHVDSSFRCEADGCDFSSLHLEIWFEKSAFTGPSDKMPQNTSKRLHVDVAWV